MTPLPTLFHISSLFEAKPVIYSLNIFYLEKSKAIYQWVSQADKALKIRLSTLSKDVYPNKICPWHDMNTVSCRVKRMLLSTFTHYKLSAKLDIKYLVNLYWSAGITALSRCVCFFIVCLSWCRIFVNSVVEYDMQIEKAQKMIFTLLMLLRTEALR